MQALVGSRWLRFVLVGTAASLALAGCGGSGGEATRPEAPSTTSSQSANATSSPATPTSKPRRDPVKFAMTGSTTFSEVDVRKTAMTDSAVVTMTPKKLIGRTLPGLAISFEVPAKSGDFTDFWISNASNTAISVAVTAKAGPGTRAGTTSYTVTRYDLKTGQVLKSANVEAKQDPLDGATPTTVRVVGAVGDVVFLDSWAAASPSDAFASASARHTTLAVDLGRGEVAWSAQPAHALVVSGNVVIVNTGTAKAPGVIRALLVKNGSTKWSALTRVGSAAPVGIQGTRMVVTTARPSGKGAAVTRLSLRDGAVGPQRATSSWNWTCFDTSRAIAVCTVVGSNHVLGWDLNRNAAVWRLPTSRRFAPAVSTVDGDMVYGQASGQGVALNALTGKDLATNTGSVPTHVSVWGAVSLLDGQAIFQRGIEDR